ncbi:MAG: hypothetical protein P9E24_09260 [Candidatus Competibacter sp.]|nr:hypothetical protein [Candidatus Competibacter sp.]MDG4582890.1 hypothetical protein [Candidatus Competibacter sp.]
MAMAYPSQSAAIVARIMREQLGLANAGGAAVNWKSLFIIHHVAPDQCKAAFHAPLPCIQAGHIARHRRPCLARHRKPPLDFFAAPAGRSRLSFPYP